MPLTETYTGQGEKIDNAIQNVLTEISDIIGPVHFGMHVIQDWNTFLSLSSVAENPQDTSDRTLRFCEYYITDIIDDRENAPTKRTERIHSYEVVLYTEYDDLFSHRKILEMTRAVMDLLQNNYQISDFMSRDNGSLVSVSPARSVVALDNIEESYVVYRSTITFSVREDIRHQ